MQDLELRTLEVIERSRELLALNGSGSTPRKPGSGGTGLPRAAPGRSRLAVRGRLTGPAAWLPDPAELTSRAVTARRRALTAMEAFAAVEEQAARIHEDLAARRPEPRAQFRHSADEPRARGGPATRRRAGGHPQAMTLAEKPLVTMMRQRLGVPRPVLAELLGVAPNTIGTAERQVKPLPARAGHIIEPTTTPLTTLADLTAYATSHGVTLTPKTKPAR